MLFNSIHFLIFFPVVAGLYFFVPHKYRWILLLLASYYFYMSWEPAYALLIMLSTVVDYAAGIWMGKAVHIGKRKVLLLLSLCTNLGLLVLFKYFNFLGTSLEQLFGFMQIDFTSPTLNVLLPVGISFYTFQTLSYTIDVYRRKIEPERHLGIFAVYVSFFPQLVAGPIERAKNLLPQFFEKHNFDYARVTDGLKLMLWGVYKKVVIADGVAIFVDRVYGDIGAFSGPSLWFATVLFSIQIYADFSGYSDIAIGAARVLGFRLMDNFRAPYLAKHIVDFWRKWHISLSSWLKDYLYIPLGGNRKGTARKYLNLFIVFTLIGLWHGANWTFVMFGVYHSAWMIGYNMTKRFWDKTPLLLQIISTYIITTVGWIFFRAASLSDAFTIIEKLFTPAPDGIVANLKRVVLHSEYELVILCIPVLLLIIAHKLVDKHGNIVTWVNMKSRWMRWSIYYGLIMMIFLFGAFGSQEFIYFNF